MKRLLMLVLWLLPVAATAQTGTFQNWCQAGGIFASVSGINSTTPMQGSFPKCQVSVVLTGSSTPATLYSTSTLTPLANPFCANADGSFLFYAATTNLYDITISNSLACNPASGGYAQLPSPFSWFDAAVSGSGGGGGGGAPGGSPGQIQYNVGGSAFGGFTANGDCTIATPSGLVTCTKSNGTPFGSAAFVSATAGGQLSGTLPSPNVVGLYMSSTAFTFGTAPSSGTPCFGYVSAGVLGATPCGGINGQVVGQPTVGLTSTSATTTKQTLIASAYAVVNPSDDACQLSQVAWNAVPGLTGDVTLDVPDVSGAENCSVPFFPSLNLSGHERIQGARTILTVAQSIGIGGSTIVEGESNADTAKVASLGGTEIKAANGAFQPVADGGTFFVPSRTISSMTRGTGGNSNYIIVVLSGQFPAYPSAVKLGPINLGRLVQLVNNNGPNGGTGVTLGDTLANGNGIFQVVGCGVGNYTGGTCSQSTTTFSILDTTGTVANCASCTGTAYLETYVVYVGNSGGNEYHAKLRGVAIDCQFLPGVGAYLDYSGEEGVDADPQIYNCMMPSIRIHLGFCDTYSNGFCPEANTNNAFSASASSAINSGGDGWRFEINFGYETCLLSSGCGSNGAGGVGWTNGTSTVFCSTSADQPYLNPDPCAPNWIGLMIDGPGVGGVLHNSMSFTISEADPHGARIAEMTTSAVCALIYGVGVDISGHHTEYCPNPFLIGGDTNINGAFAGAPTYNVAMRAGFDGVSTAGGNYSYDIGSIAANPLSGQINAVRQISIQGAVGNVSIGASKALNDNITGRKIDCYTSGATTTNDYAFWYEIGTDGSVLTDSNCPDAYPQMQWTALSTTGNNAATQSPFTVFSIAGQTADDSDWFIPGSSSTLAMKLDHNSNLTVNGSTGVVVPNGGISLGSTSLTATACPSGVTGAWCAAEASTAGMPTAGVDYLRADSTNHCLEYSKNGGAEACVGAGSGTVTGTGTANYFALWSGSSVIGNGHLLDNGTTISGTEPFSITPSSTTQIAGTFNVPASSTASFIAVFQNNGTNTDAFSLTGEGFFGTSVPNPTVGTAGGSVAGEGTAYTGASGQDGWYANATNHCFDVIFQTVDEGCVLNTTSTVVSNFTAHQFWGNSTASTTAPAATLLGASDVSPPSYVAGAGIAQAQTATFSPAVTALTPGLQVRWLPTAANTGAAPTLAVNGLAAKNITKLGTTALVANDLTTTAIATAIYDGTQWELQNPQTVTAGGVTSVNTLTGAVVIEAATAGQVAISGGNAAALTGAVDLTYATHTFSGISTTIFDLSAATGTAAFKVPSTTTNTASAAGAITFDTTNKNYHGFVNAADSIFANFASTPTTNVIPKAVIASGNTLLANSTITDNGTIVSTTEGLQLGAANCTVFGTAGGLCAGEGTSATNVASTSNLYPDSTAHEWKAATNGSTSYGLMVRAQPGAIRSTGLVAAVTTATLCAALAGACNVAGTYHIHIALYQSGVACTTNTTGGITPTLTWTDGNGTAHTAVGVPLETNSSLIALTGTMLFNQTGSGIGTVFGSGDINIDTNGTIIQYALGFAQCSVSGTATYAASLVATRLQ